MNYDHAYHAGNIADVVKHLTLIHLIHALQRKPTGFLYLDTHAGKGVYDLSDPHFTKTEEAKNGIYSLWPSLQENSAPTIQSYCSLLKAYNPDKRLRYYPGSVLLAKALLRKQDRLAAAEYAPLAFSTLKTHQAHRVHLVCENGYQFLKSLLPAPEKRALILIDPPFEDAQEWKHITKGLHDIAARQANAVVLVWYPLKAQLKVKTWLKNMTHLPFKSLFCIHWSALHKKPDTSLTSAGLLCINPPWQFEAQSKALLHTLPLHFDFNWLSDS